MNKPSRCACTGFCGTDHFYGGGRCGQIVGEPIRGRRVPPEAYALALPDDCCVLCRLGITERQEAMDRGMAEIAGDPRQGRLLEP